MKPAAIDLELAEDEVVVTLISRQIYRHLCAVSSEQYHPGPDADRMDDTIATNKARAAQLRAIRIAFEDARSGVLP